MSSELAERERDDAGSTPSSSTSDTMGSFGPSLKSAILGLNVG